jgi:UDP:flavonoid glycosyltransferase YjiC (YdhE family)
MARDGLSDGCFNAPMSAPESPPKARHILLAAFGTRGDVQPMMALGLALKARGHEVTVAASPDSRAFVEAEGLTFKGVGIDYREFIRIIGTEPLRALPLIRSQIQVQWDAMAPMMKDVDAIVGSGVLMVGQELADHGRVPYRYTTFAPSQLPSGDHGTPFFPVQGLPRWVNRFLWWLNYRIWDLMFGGPLNRVRASMGLGPVGEIWPHFLSEELIIASEPALAPVPEDSTLRVRQTGYWFYTDRDELPEEVEHFLQAGPPPVYIGFGSMQGKDGGRGARAIEEALRATGLRAIISRGWEQLEVKAPDLQVLSVGVLPHGKLFPRCLAVVHHGGAGTTSTTARAGVPQVLVPHLDDQFYTGRWLLRRGLSAATLPRPKLRAGPLAAALRACKEDEALRGRARTFAQGMVLDGVERAARLVEELFEKPRPAQG